MVKQVLKKLHKKFRFMMPLFEKKEIHYNDVKVMDQKVKFLDAYNSNIITEDKKEYESNYIPAIKKHVKKGDSVVVIGGGWGVSTVIAANRVGERGKVTTFEAAYTEVQKAKNTVKINQPPGEVRVEHAIVGDAIDLRGKSKGANHLDPKDLPQCDVLLVDCDGAEISLLDEMQIRPYKVIVEHHAVVENESIVVDYIPEKIRRIMREKRYKSVEESVESFPETRPSRPDETVFVFERREQ